MCNNNTIVLNNVFLDYLNPSVATLYALKAFNTSVLNSYIGFMFLVFPVVQFF